MLLKKKKKHQERVTREGLANIYFDLLLGHNDRVCSDFVCSLVKSGSFTFVLDSRYHTGIFPASHFARQTVKPILQGTSKISHGNCEGVGLPLLGKERR